MCSPSLHEVTADEEESKSYFLGSVESDVSEPDASEPEPAWYTDLYTNRSHVRFKIDCGADVTVISEKTYRSMRDRPKLKQAHVKLDTLGGPLTCKGQFIARVQRNQHTVFVRMYVVNGDFDNLISRGDAVKLQLIARLGTLKDSSSTLTASTSSPTQRTRALRRPHRDRLPRTRRPRCAATDDDNVATIRRPTRHRVPTGQAKATDAHADPLQRLCGR